MAAGKRVEASEASVSTDEREELLPEPEQAWQQQEREGEQEEGRTAAVSAKLRGMIQIVYTASECASYNSPPPAFPAASPAAAAASVVVMPLQRCQCGAQLQPASLKLLVMRHVVLSAVGLTAAMYCLLGLFGYMCFSTQEIGANILDMYAFDDPAIQVARVMLALIQLVSYPINLLPARAAIWHLLEAAAARRVRMRGFHTLSTLAFFGATLAVALSTTDLGMMFQLIGGTCGAVLIFGMPGGLLMGYAWQQHRAPGCGEQQQSEAGLPPAAADPELGSWPEKRQSLDQNQEPEEELTAAQPARAGVMIPCLLYSKLWWSGLALVLLTAWLCAYSLHSVLAA